MIRKSALLLCLGLSLLTGAAQADPGRYFNDFSSGAGGWEGMNPDEPLEGWGTWVDSTSGATAPLLHSRQPATFWSDFRNSTDTRVIGDYTKTGGFTISLDIKAESILYYDVANDAFVEVPRDLVVELRSYNNPASGLPFTSVWYVLGTIGADIDWQRLSVTVSDPHATALPAGWGGYGGVGPDGGSALPAGVSFADVLRHVDEVVFTTATPDYIYGYTYQDLKLDNIQISAVPEPSTLLMQGLGLVALLGLTRHRRRAAD